MSFDHYISYGSTDQESLRDLAGKYDGLVVPGTIAAFQADGTRGFVLTWSARNGKPYFIDSRFPLFQNALPKAKKSHRMLAEVFGDSSLVSASAPSATDFPVDRIDSLAERWVEFNLGFDQVTTKVFDKYAARLGEEILPEAKSRPSLVLPPYFMAEHQDDPWYTVTKEFWIASQRHARGLQIRRMVAATEASGLKSMLLDVPAGEDVVVWVSGLDEYRSRFSELFAYGAAIRDSVSRGISPFALYGGYYSILLSKFGLAGSSHGVGFGDHRDWVELPSSGAPQARYYVYSLHRYVPVDLAVAMWRAFPELIVDPRFDDPKVSPGSLSYHDLMRHSLRMRHEEITQTADRGLGDLMLELSAAAESFAVVADQIAGPQSLRRRAQELYVHLGLWVSVLEALDE